MLLSVKNDLVKSCLLNVILLSFSVLILIPKYFSNSILYLHCFKEMFIGIILSLVAFLNKCVINKNSHITTNSDNSKFPLIRALSPGPKVLLIPLYSPFFYSLLNTLQDLTPASLLISDNRSSNEPNMDAVSSDMEISANPLIGIF